MFSPVLNYLGNIVVVILDRRLMLDGGRVSVSQGVSPAALYRCTWPRGDISPLLPPWRETPSGEDSPALRLPVGILGVLWLFSQGAR